MNRVKLRLSEALPPPLYPVTLDVLVTQGMGLGLCTW